MTEIYIRASILVLPISSKSKKDSYVAVFLGEGIFTMGLVKTIYNVLGGFYMNYNSTNPTESVHKLNKSFKVFLCTFSPLIFILSTFHKNMHNKTRFFTPGFVFANFRYVLYLFVNTFFIKKCFEFLSGNFFFLQKKVCTSI